MPALAQVSSTARGLPARSWATLARSPSRASKDVDRIGLVEADFDRRQPALLEQLRELRSERAIGVEPLFAGEQGLVRLIFAHARAKLGAVGNVRRVAQDQVELLA